MNILVTGAKGFIGKNLCIALNQIKNGNDKSHISLNGKIDEIFEFDKNNSEQDLEYFCSKADFVYNFVGSNRPQNNNEFMKVNLGFSNKLIEILIKNNNKCPIMLSSSIQANLNGRFINSEYGKSKLASEELLFKYSNEFDVKVFVYRLPNVFGKWCKPNYNSVIATFCNNIANELPIVVNDRNVELELLYIDDLVNDMIDLLENSDSINANKPLSVNKTYNVSLGYIIDKLYEYNSQSKTLEMSNIPIDSFEEKLYATFISYLPIERIKIPLKMNVDDRGSFTEIMRTCDHGQFSVNISKPGIKKGNHFHNTKWEYFIVVSGHALIQERRIGFDENGNEYPLIEFEVSSEKLEAVRMLPGYKHSIINLSNNENLVTLMWISEKYCKEKPDTFFEEV